MTRRYHARRQSRQALLWRVFYGSGELVGQGSIVDVHKNGCRISGRMPVEVGSHLRLCIWPTDNPTDIVVAQGIVRWARGLEFGLLLDAHMPDLDELARQLASVLGQNVVGTAPPTPGNVPYKPVGGGPESMPN
jgi:hypothetical protein